MSELVIDKSFLDGASYRRVADTCAAFKVLCSENLFFELMTTESNSQVRCISKLPDRPNTFALVPNIGTLLRFELENRTPCVPLYDRRIQGAYVFNPKLRDGTYVPEGEVLEALTAWRAQVADETTSFLQRCQVVYQFFPQLNGIEFRDLPTAVSYARTSVATDAALVRGIYAALMDEEAPSNALEPSLLDQRWAWFRWVQCQLLAALRMFQRYQCNIPDPPSPKVRLKAEHSMHDVEYVLLASLARGIATHDGEIEEDFRLLCTDGQVVRLGST